MNKIILIAGILFLLYGSSMAQLSVELSLQSNIDTISVSGFADDRDIPAKTTIHNNSADTAYVVWRRFEDIPVEWTSAVCDGNVCYPVEVDIPIEYFTIEPGGNDPLEVHFYPDNFPGNGTVTIKAWDMRDSAGTVITGTYKGTAEEVTSSASSVPQENDKIRIYPNPAKDYILIKNLPEKEVSTVEVYNIFGRRMLSFSQAANNTDTVQKFEINTLTKGIYMIRVFDERMNVIYTESLSKE